MRRAVVFAALMGIMTIAGRGQSAAPWNLIEHTIATDLRGGYHVTAADMNKDGRTDLLAVATGPKVDLVWFENPSSSEARSAKEETWTRHVMASGYPGMINADAFDVDGDGYPEVVLQSGFSTTPAKGDGRLILLTKGADVNAPWTAKEFDHMPSVHRVRWMDAYGNGRKIAVSAPLGGVNGAPPDYKDTVSIYAYDPKNDYKRETITDADEGVLHGISVVDWDGKGRDALLSASFMGIHLHRFNNGKWERTRLAPGSADPWPKNGSSDVVVLRTKAGRQLAAIEPWHGNQVAVYVKGKREVIDDSLVDGPTIAAADLNGDGNDEIIAGYRGKGRSVYLYYFEKKKWRREALDDGGMPAASCAAADLNGDGRTDVACIGAATANLKIYENVSSR